MPGLDFLLEAFAEKLEKAADGEAAVALAGHEVVVEAADVLRDHAAYQGEQHDLLELVELARERQALETRQPVRLPGHLQSLLALGLCVRVSRG